LTEERKRILIERAKKIKNPFLINLIGFSGLLISGSPDPENLI